MSNVVKIVSVDEGGFINIDQFADLIDVSRVEFYRITPNGKEGHLLVEFFDKDEKPIKPKSPKSPKKPRKSTKKAA